MCHPNAGILSGGSSLFSRQLCSDEGQLCLVGGGRPRAGGARVGRRGRERIARGGLVRVAEPEVLGGRVVVVLAASSAAAVAVTASRLCSSSERASGVGVVGVVGPSPPSRASSPPRIHASGTTLSLYSACSARNGPCLAHMASRRCPDSRRWRIRGVDDAPEDISRERTGGYLPRARRQRGDDVAVAALPQVDVLERAGTPRASLQGRHQVVGAAAAGVAAVR